MTTRSIIEPCKLEGYRPGVVRPLSFSSCLLGALMLVGCSIDRGAVLGAGDGGAGGEALASQAETAFAVTPRTTQQAREAYTLMREAAERSASSDTSRYDYLQRAARFAIWLIYNAAGDTLIDQALLLTNTAVAIDSNRVEGYYYRAITVGLLAQNDKTRGRAAMRDIREDAERAIAIDANFDHGGPPRVLGALYLRAPGPPAGIGSLRRATPLLEQAYQLAPNYPENILFLTEAYLENERIEEARSLLDSLSEDLNTYGDEIDQERWQARAEELRRELRL